MVYTTNELITGAYYAAGVVSRGFETVSGEQISDGLLWLNNIITEKDVDDGMIPYETTYTFNAVIGQQAYPIENLISIDTVVFYKNSVRFSMEKLHRNEYFGSDRVENINSLPNKWYFERGLGGGTLYIYFLPNEAYPMELHGTFRLTEVSLGDNLDSTLDQFYITYLRYALAYRICAEYNYKVPEGVKDVLSQYEAFINKKSRVLDLRINKQSTLQRRGSLNWAYINLGRGWLVP